MRKGLSKRTYRVRVAVTSAALLLATISGAALLPAVNSGQASAQDCSQPSFTTVAPASTGTFPWALTSGDFNNDGQLDLATANIVGDNVSVLIGDGSGGFAAPVDFGNVSSPFSIVASDLDNDGNTDIAAANAGTDSVTVLKGDGHGGFAFGGFFAVGSMPLSLAVADVNGDGDPDLASANYLSDSVSVLIGDGSGGFAPAVSYAAGYTPISIAAGDLDLSGSVDLVVANSASNSVSVLSGSGDGSFAPEVSFGVGEFPAAVAFGDLNGDGRPDLLAANASHDVSVLLNNDGGVFGPATNWPTGSAPGGIATGDFNNDGIRDVATSNSGSGDTTVLLGTGGGNFAPGVNIAVGMEPASIVSADLDGNNSLDLAVANRGSNNVSMLLNNCVSSNAAPTIAAAAVSRQQGAGSSALTVGTVNDAEDAETALNITVNGGASATVNGVSVSGVTVDAAGNVDAVVAAACGSSNASFTLRVTDSAGLFAEAVMNVTVSASNAPMIGLNSPISLFPHNGKMHALPVSHMLENISDDCDLDISANAVIEKVTSDETDSKSVSRSGRKSGATASSASNDIIIGNDCRSVLLRSSRDNNGDGRVYSVTLRITDSSGNTTRADYKVTVPLGPSVGSAVEGGARSTVMSSCL